MDMEQFNVATKCRKIRDDILYFKYGKSRISVEFPIETKQFFNTTSSKIQSMSYQSIKDIEKDVQDYVDAIGVSNFATPKKNSFEKFVKNVFEEYHSSSYPLSFSSSTSTEILGQDQDQDQGREVSHTSNSSSGKQTCREYDNFTELNTNTFAGYCHVVFHAILPHYNSTLLGAPYFEPSSSLSSSRGSPRDVYKEQYIRRKASTNFRRLQHHTFVEMDPNYFGSTPFIGRSDYPDWSLHPLHPFIAPSLGNHPRGGLWQPPNIRDGSSGGNQPAFETPFRY